jgi:hypothetical protein
MRSALRDVMMAGPGSLSPLDSSSLLPSRHEEAVRARRPRNPSKRVRAAVSPSASHALRHRLGACSARSRSPTKPALNARPLSWPGSQIKSGQAAPPCTMLLGLIDTALCGTRLANSSSPVSGRVEGASTIPCTLPEFVRPLPRVEFQLECHAGGGPAPASSSRFQPEDTPSVS